MPAGGLFLGGFPAVDLGVRRGADGAVLRGRLPTQGQIFDFGRPGCRLFLGGLQAVAADPQRRGRRGQPRAQPLRGPVRAGCVVLRGLPPGACRAAGAGQRLVFAVCAVPADPLPGVGGGAQAQLLGRRCGDRAAVFAASARPRVAAPGGAGCADGLLAAASAQRPVRQIRGGQGLWGGEAVPVRGGSGAGVDRSPAHGFSARAHAAARSGGQPARVFFGASSAHRGARLVGGPRHRLAGGGAH